MLPSYALSKTILSDSGIHCYVIPNLLDGEKVAYSGSSCQNDYTNKAISFIKRIKEILELRISKVTQLQENYSNTWRSLNKEISNLNNGVNNIYSIINDKLNLEIKANTNCSSIRFDLINFSWYMGEKTQYKARIILIFGAFTGTFGWALLYFLMIVINSRTNGVDEES